MQEWIGSYDDEPRRASLRRIPNLIPRDPEDGIRVLDVGGGWGPVTTAVLEAYPRAQVVLHDFSAPMLEESRRRLARFGNAVSFHRGDLLSPEWEKGLQGSFDAVVSSLAIHNVRFPDRIKAIYGEIFTLVAPGGCFINLDSITRGERSRMAMRHADAMERRRRVFEETGEWKPLDDASRASRLGRVPHVDAPPTDADLRRIAAHEPATLANQLRWLLEVGFAEADCFARDGGSALMGAFRD